MYICNLCAESARIDVSRLFQTWYSCDECGEWRACFDHSKDHSINNKAPVIASPPPKVPWAEEIIQQHERRRKEKSVRSVA